MALTISICTRITIFLLKGLVFFVDRNLDTPICSFAPFSSTFLEKLLVEGSFSLGNVIIRLTQIVSSESMLILDMFMAPGLCLFYVIRLRYDLQALEVFKLFDFMSNLRFLSALSLANRTFCTRSFTVLLQSCSCATGMT